MNKQELIEKIEALPDNIGLIRPHIDKKVVLGLVRQLDEPQKVVVPQFVAGWIEVAKSVYPLYGGMTYGSPGVKKWLENDDNQRIFALAWLDGYEVEEEKRYLVKIIGITNYNSYLNYHKGENKWTIESRVEIDAIRTEHTRKELEDANFGWVFDCPGIEIEEVIE